MKSPGGRGGRGVVLLIGLRCPVVKDLLDVRDREFTRVTAWGLDDLQGHTGSSPKVSLLAQR